jgi:hypothetical protein
VFTLYFSVPHLKYSLKSKNPHHPSQTHHPPSHRRPFSDHSTHRRPPFNPIFHFFPHFSRKPISQKFFNFFHLFLLVLGTNPFLDCDPVFLFVFGSVFAGGWVTLKRGSPTLLNSGCPPGARRKSPTNLQHA